MAKDNEACPQMFAFSGMEGKHALAVYHQWEQQDYFNWEKQIRCWII